MSDNNNLLLGLGLIVGAVYYSRRTGVTMTASPRAAAVAAPLGAGSMPGSVGTGVAQKLGGLLGNLLAQKVGGGTSTGAPVTNTAMDQFPEMAGDGVLQNSIEAADPMQTFDPQIGGETTDWLAGLA